MPRLRRLSGAEIIASSVASVSPFTHNVGATSSSVVSLIDGTTQTLTVPSHPELDTGTCRAIFRQASRFVPEEDLRPHFYSD